MTRRKDGRWQKRITLPDGKSKLLYSTASTERLAVKDFNEQMLQLKQKDSDSKLFENVAELWKEEHFPKLQNNSLKAYKPGYSAAVNYFKGQFIADIRPLDIKQYVENLEVQGYALKTIKNRLLVVSLIFKFAVLNEFVNSDPCIKISMSKNLPKTKRKKASKEDEQKILHSTDSLCGILAYVYLTTGCRRGEAVALTPKDINLTNKTISINKTVEWVGNQPQIKNSPKTDAGFREIPITDKLIELLAPYMNQKYIFEKDGNLFGHTQLSKMWAKFQTNTNITCTPHQLRHSYATMLFDADVDVKTAQKWMGHANINTTLGIYTHLSETRLEQTTKKFRDYVDKICA